MKKSSIIVIATVVVLAVAVGVLAFFNADNLDLKKELEMNAEFEIKMGEITKRITMEDMLGLSPVQFNAIMDTSKTDPEQVEFTGVELKKICEFLEIDITSAEILEIRALDGYSSALTLENVEKDDNVYICIAMNNEPLKSKSEGGFGPYMMVINSAKFSQSWCKFLQEIVIK